MKRHWRWGGWLGTKYDLEIDLSNVNRPRFSTFVEDDGRRRWVCFSWGSATGDAVLRFDFVMRHKR